MRRRAARRAAGGIVGEGAAAGIGEGGRPAGGVGYGDHVGQFDGAGQGGGGDGQAGGEVLVELEAVASGAPVGQAKGQDEGVGGGDVGGQAAVGAAAEEAAGGQFGEFPADGAVEDGAEEDPGRAGQLGGGGADGLDVEAGIDAAVVEQSGSWQGLHVVGGCRSGSGQEVIGFAGVGQVAGGGAEFGEPSSAGVGGGQDEVGASGHGLLGAVDDGASVAGDAAPQVVRVVDQQVAGQVQGGQPDGGRLDEHGDGRVGGASAGGAAAQVQGPELLAEPTGRQVIPPGQAAGQIDDGQAVADPARPEGQSRPAEDTQRGVDIEHTSAPSEVLGEVLRPTPSVVPRGTGEEDPVRVHSLASGKAGGSGRRDRAAARVVEAARSQRGRQAACRPGRVGTARRRRQPTCVVRKTGRVIWPIWDWIASISSTWRSSSFRMSTSRSFVALSPTLAANSITAL